MSHELTIALHERGMRVTPQRVVLHRALRELDRHVTADELLDAVTEHLPNVSLPTIYATLELLEELGMVRRVQRAGTTLFDPRTDPHHHLICTTCGAVDDLDCTLDTARLESAARRRGFEHERIEVVVQGCCAHCRDGAHRQSGGGDLTRRGAGCRGRRGRRPRRSAAARATASRPDAVPAQRQPSVDLRSGQANVPPAEHLTRSELEQPTSLDLPPVVVEDRAQDPCTRRRG
jgi:Fe2+ or Zn2+ uptake regulation protein